MEHKRLSTFLILSHRAYLLAVAIISQNCFDLPKKFPMLSYFSWLPAWIDMREMMEGFFFVKHNGRKRLQRINAGKDCRCVTVTSDVDLQLLQVLNDSVCVRHVPGPAEPDLLRHLLKGDPPVVDAQGREEAGGGDAVQPEAVADQRNASRQGVCLVGDAARTRNSKLKEIYKIKQCDDNNICNNNDDDNALLLLSLNISLFQDDC